MIKAPYEPLDDEYMSHISIRATKSCFGFIALVIFLMGFLNLLSQNAHETNADFASNVEQFVQSYGEVKSSLPNIVFIYADDIGYNSIGLKDYKYSKAFKTLSTLARNGIIMNNYYGQELCAPSRSSLLTGRYPISVGMEEKGPYETAWYGLGSDQTTIAEVLTQNGYNAYHFGKWDLGVCSPDMLATGQGFNNSLGYTQASNYYWTKRNPDYPHYYDFLQSNSSCYWTYKKHDKNRLSTYLYTDHLVDLLSDYDSERPFFVYMAYQNAHTPFYDTNYSTGIPASYVETEVVTQIYNQSEGARMRQYALSVAVLDHEVSRIVSTLSETNQLDNTYIIFASDNGGCVYGGSTSGPYRGTKATLFEGGTKVDAFIYSPLLGDLSGQVYQGLMHVSDWFPTILEMVNITYVAESGYSLDGISQYSGWKDSSTTLTNGPRQEMLYNWYASDTGNQTFAVRNSRFKLILEYVNDDYTGWYGDETTLEDDDNIVYLDDDDAGENIAECSSSGLKKGSETTYFLFDLEKDPYEKINLYNSTSSVHEKAKKNLLTYFHKMKNLLGSKGTCDYNSSVDILSVWDSNDYYITPWTAATTSGLSYCSS